MDTLIALTLLLSLLWFWSDTLRSRELALKTSSHLCHQIDVQLLDQSVVLQRLRLKRNHNGYLVLQRSYQFEFSIDGVDRYRGHVVLMGRRLASTEMEHPEGRLIS